jgi:hypothetical protein
MLIMKYLLLIIFILSVLVQARAQSPAPPPPMDPTVPDAALQQLLMASGGMKSGSKLPEIMMRGKIVTSDGWAVVILEVNQQILTLRAGSPLNLPGEHSQLSLQLSEVTREGVSIEVLPLKQTIRFP